MLERLPYEGEPDSVKVGRVAALATMLVGETVTVIGAIEASSTEAFAGGSLATVTLAALAAAKVPKMLGFKESDS